jgi:hypothetical protein
MMRSRGAGTPESTPSSQRRMFRSGTLLIIGLGAFLLFGWNFYRQTLPVAWLYDFSEAIALHAAPDPNPPEPEDIRQVSPRPPVEDPYICVGRVIDLPWDKLFVVTSEQDLQSHAVLSDAVWQEQSLQHYVDLLVRDDRYQLIVLVQGRDVLDAQLYFTFWGDLTALAQPEGFSRARAVFTSNSLEGRYIVSPADDAPVDSCT